MVSEVDIEIENEKEMGVLVLVMESETGIAIVTETATRIESVVAMVNLADTAPVPAPTHRPVARMERDSGWQR